MPALIPVIIFGFIALVWNLIGSVVKVLIQPLLNSLNQNDPTVPLAPADVADMVERNILPEAEGAQEAAKSGVNSSDFGLMVLNTGEPYGIEQAIELYRRGLIDESRLEQVVYYSRVRNEFFPDILQLAHETMSAADAIEAALKGVISQEEAANFFTIAGGLPEQYQILFDAAGDAIGVETAVTLHQHGLISDSDLTLVLEHSRLNPMFFGMAEQTRYKFLEIFQIETALKAGTLAPQLGAEWLAQLGYQQDQIVAFVTGATAGKTAAHKNLTESQITQLYDTGVLNFEQASAELQGLGYDPGETDYILAIYNQKRELSMATAAVGQVRKVFLAKRIDWATASNMLDSLGIDPTARDFFGKIWAVEQASELKMLTESQIGDAVKAGYIDDQTALGRWASMGYDDTDAGLLLAYYTGTPPAGSPAALAAGATGTVG